MYIGIWSFSIFLPYSQIMHSLYSFSLFFTFFHLLSPFIFNYMHHLVRAQCASWGSSLIKSRLILLCIKQKTKIFVKLNDFGVTKPFKSVPVQETKLSAWVLANFFFCLSICFLFSVFVFMLLPLTFARKLLLLIVVKYRR